MRITKNNLKIETRGNTDVINITEDVENALDKSGLADGFVTLSVLGSTASLTTIEYEPNLVRDIKNALDRLIPENITYEHTKTWGDHNGHSHIRASLIGPSLQVLFSDKKLYLGTWQQIILIDFDNRPRHREILVQMIGN